MSQLVALFATIVSLTRVGDAQPLTNTSSIYASGDVVLANPIESTTIVLVVVIVLSIVEFAIDSASSAPNKYFRLMFNVIMQEVMVIGVLVISLIFTETVYAWPVDWVFTLKWSMMCLFVMILIFVGQILLLILISRLAAKRWASFESLEMDSQTDLKGWQDQYKRSFVRFVESMEAYGYTASLGVKYSEYLGKAMRRNLFGMTDLSWVSWAFLATVVVLNGLRVEATMKISQIGIENIVPELSMKQRIINYASFVVIVGYGVLTFFLLIYRMLINRLDDFLRGSPGIDRGAIVNDDGTVRRRERLYVPNDSGGVGPLTRPLISADALDDSRSYLFRRSLQATLELMQTVLLLHEWYLATFALGFAYQIVMELTVAWTVVFLVFAAAPTLTIFLLLPRAMLAVTILGSLGTSLDENAVQYFIRKANVPQEEWPAKMLRKMGVAAPKKRELTVYTDAGSSEVQSSTAPIAELVL